MNTIMTAPTKPNYLMDDVIQKNVDRLVAGDIEWYFEQRQGDVTEWPLEAE